MKVMFLVGIPGSGKSHFAKELAKKERAVIISTDEIRSEKFGEESRQGKTRIIYKELFLRLDKCINKNINVIIDATNVERERRMKILKKLKNIETHCYYFDTPYEICLERNKNRKRKVEDRIMKKMRSNLEFPMLNEGFDEIHIVHEPMKYNMEKEEFIELIKGQCNYEELFINLLKIPIFKDIYKFNQENPHHQFLLCEHTYYVYEYINEYYDCDDKLILQLAALLHDTGKPFTKKFKNDKNYYSYFGHENVSSQIACHLLIELGFDEKIVIDIANIVQMHMLINYGGFEGARQIYHLLGEDLLTKLYFFREADKFAK